MNSKILSKVFVWMSIGLAVTFITGSLVANNPDLLLKIFSNRAPLILAILEIALVLYLSVRITKMKSSTAKLVFMLYSVLTGLTFSAIFLVYSVSSIMSIFLVTSLIMLIFSMLGLTSKIDLSKISTYLFMALIAVVIVSIVNMFVGSSQLELILSIICTILFIGYIAYDVQTIIRLYDNDVMEEDNLAIYGALQLYLDFINIFLQLLSLFGKEK